MTKMTLAEELAWRGQLKDMTFDDPSWLDQPRTFYLGVDAASANSLTIGNLAIYMMARRLLKHGWQAVLLFGGATSLIGDPGGKEAERELKPKSEIEANITAIEQQVRRLVNDVEFQTVNNYDWFADIKYLDFLREVGKHYSMTELLQRDFIQSRIGEGGSGISYAEFSYSLIQGYDYWHLYKQYGVELQIGGSDQWGNMLSGVPLIRKKENAEVHALSMPLVIDPITGRKFGKSEAGAVWLDPAQTSVYQFYQFWLNVDDTAAGNYLKIYTELEPRRIDDIISMFEQDRPGRLAQKTLAYEVTAIVHGADRAESVKRVSEVLFAGGDYSQLTAEDFEILKDELPYVAADSSADLVDVLVSSGLASSNSEARRFIQEKAVYVNGSQIADRNSLQPGDKINGHAVIRRGKNSMAVLNLK